MSELCLNQMITHPTHKDGNILDLILTNNKELIHSYQCVPTTKEISHHCIIEVATTYTSKGEELQRPEEIKRDPLDTSITLTKI